MSAILWMVRDEVPADQNDVRNTATPVSVDAPAAELPGPPQLGDFPETYPDPSLGMSRRDLAGDYTPSKKSPPGWGPMVDANHEYNDIINRQVSSSGTAAERERRGEWGHGTMPISRAIDPVMGLTDGTRLGNDYFTAERRGIGANGDYAMQPPPGYDADTTRAVAAASQEASKEARRANYAGWFAEMGYGGS